MLFVVHLFRTNVSYKIELTEHAQECLTVFYILVQQLDLDLSALFDLLIIFRFHLLLACYDCSYLWRVRNALHLMCLDRIPEERPRL